VTGQTGQSSWVSGPPRARPWAASPSVRVVGSVQATADSAMLAVVREGTSGSAGRTESTSDRHG
jgi:hypothetical protein